MAVAAVVSQTTAPSTDGLRIVVTTTYDNGMVTVTSVPADNTPEANAQTLLQRAAQALTNNATYLARQSPTSAQNTAQIQALTRQVNALIRLLAVDDTSTITDS